MRRTRVGGSLRIERSRVILAVSIRSPVGEVADAKVRHLKGRHEDRL